MLPDIDTIATLGGVLANYAPIEDPTTDLDAGADNIARGNVAMMTATAGRAMRRFAGHGTTPTDPSTGFVHAAVWGSSSGVKPTVTRSGAGIYLVTWPATVDDALNVQHAVNLRIAKAWVETASSTRYNADARVTSANIVEVRVFTDAAPGVLNDAVGLNIVVVAW